MNAINDTSSRQPTAPATGTGRFHSFDALRGFALLLGVFFHVYAIMTDLPINVAGSAKRLHSGWLAFYVVFLPCVILHTGIGVYRIAVKYGVCVKSAKDMCRKWIWIVMGCYLLLGSLALARVWFQG